MIPICTEHAALLRTVAKNIKDRTAIRAYSDFLQDQNCCGWLIVAAYDPEDWPVWMGGNTGWSAATAATGGYGKKVSENWKLPWLSGSVRFDKWVQQGRHRIKYILEAYANGEVLL